MPIFARWTCNVSLQMNCRYSHGSGITAVVTGLPVDGRCMRMGSSMQSDRSFIRSSTNFLFQNNSDHMIGR